MAFESPELLFFEEQYKRGEDDRDNEQGSGGGVLHALDGFGVIYEPLSRFEARFVKVKFGEWHP